MARHNNAALFYFFNTSYFNYKSTRSHSAFCDTIHLLPYHSFGENKYNLLGRQYPLSEAKSIAEASMATLKATIESSGFNCHIGG